MHDPSMDQQWAWEPARRRPILFAIVWMAVGGVLALAGTTLFLILSMTIGMLTGYIPAFEAVPGQDLSWRSREFLREQHLIEEGETLLYFDSIDMGKPDGDGSFFTDRRVVRYQEDPTEKHGLFVRSADYAEIESIDPVFAHGPEATSVIRVTPRRGEAFDLLVGNEEGGDRAFAERLHEMWKSPTASVGRGETK